MVRHNEKEKKTADEGERERVAVGESERVTEWESERVTEGESEQEQIWEQTISMSSMKLTMGSEVEQWNTKNTKKKR